MKYFQCKMTIYRYLLVYDCALMKCDLAVVLWSFWFTSKWKCHQSVWIPASASPHPPPPLFVFFSSHALILFSNFVFFFATIWAVSLDYFYVKLYLTKCFTDWQTVCQESTLQLWKPYLSAITKVSQWKVLFEIIFTLKHLKISVREFAVSLPKENCSNFKHVIASLLQLYK